MVCGRSVWMRMSRDHGAVEMGRCGRDRKLLGPLSCETDDGGAATRTDQVWAGLRQEYQEESTAWTRHNLSNSCQATLTDLGRGRS
jgi:hypothetical protein